MLKLLGDKIEYLNIIGLEITASEYSRVFLIKLLSIVLTSKFLNYL